MRTVLLKILLCPYCGGSLSTIPAAAASEDEIEYGILTCDCSEFPVIAGIPIFKAEGRVNIMQQTVDSVLRVGPLVEVLIKYLRAGQNDKALFSLLTVPGKLTGRTLALSECVPVWARDAIREIADFLWSREQLRVKMYFGRWATSISAMDLIAFYYQSSLGSELYNHFAFLLGQPRHLAGLSLASLMPKSGKFILDLACGFGHYMHYWGASPHGQRVIGIDRNFFQLYVAKRYVAPCGDFICSEADVRLPFSSKSFYGVFCSDAFHYFRGRWQCAEEMKRLLEPDGLIVLSRFGNLKLEPREGYEMTVERYFRLFDGMPSRMISENELLETYLIKSGPALGTSSDLEHLDSQKWLSLVASNDKSIFRDYPEFEVWPHATGRLAINPLYHIINETMDGDITLEFRFPSKWYEFENSGCAQYMPQKVHIRKETLEGLNSKTWSPEIANLLSHCVVVGMPDRYR